MLKVVFVYWWYYPLKWILIGKSMGLFSKSKPKPTTQHKNEAKAAISRFGTCAKELESATSIDAYITAMDKCNSELNLLQLYEENGVTLSMPLSQIRESVTAEIPRIERETVDRSYDRMMRDTFKLKTDAGRKRKAVRFFEELEYYYPRLQQSTIDHIKGLRGSCKFI